MLSELIREHTFLELRINLVPQVYHIQGLQPQFLLQLQLIHLTLLQGPQVLQLQPIHHLIQVVMLQGEL